jgi:hypothetical protein
MKKLLLLALFTSCAVEPATAQSQCGTREQALEFLQGQYNESVHGMGLIKDKAVMELWLSEGNATWTVTVTLPDGQTCLIASGENYQQVVSVEGDPT